MNTSEWVESERRGLATPAACRGDFLTDSALFVGVIVTIWATIP